MATRQIWWFSIVGAPVVHSAPSIRFRRALWWGILTRRCYHTQYTLYISYSVISRNSTIFNIVSQLECSKNRECGITFPVNFAVIFDKNEPAGQVAPQAPLEESANDLGSAGSGRRQKTDGFPYRNRCKSPFWATFFWKRSCKSIDLLEKWSDKKK